MTVRATRVRSADLLGQFADAGLDVRLQMLSSLVSRNRAQHLSEAVETLARFARYPKGLLGPLVFRREVRRHRDNLSAARRPRIRWSHSPARFAPMEGAA